MLFFLMKIFKATILWLCTDANGNKNYGASYGCNSKIPLNKPKYLVSNPPGKRQAAIWEATEINYLNVVLYNVDFV